MHQYTHIPTNVSVLGLKRSIMSLITVSGFLLLIGSYYIFNIVNIDGLTTFFSFSRNTGVVCFSTDNNRLFFNGHF